MTSLHLPAPTQVNLLFADPELEDAVTAWHGRAVAGSTRYSDEQYARVLDWLRRYCPTAETARSLEALVDETGIAGRTVHKILADAEIAGELVIAYRSDDALHLATTREEAAPLTRRLRRMATSLLERADARDAFPLDDHQPGLFDDAP